MQSPLGNTRIKVVIKRLSMWLYWTPVGGRRKRRLRRTYGKALDDTTARRQ